MERKKIPHCWEAGPVTVDGMSTTCMLADSHVGPHEWTRDDEIFVSFAPFPPNEDWPGGIDANDEEEDLRDGKLPPA